MTRLRILILSCLVVVTAVQLPAQSGDDVTAIRAARDRSNAAIAAHDVRAVLAEIDTAFQITSGNGRFIAGRAAMGEAFAAQFKDFPDVRYVRTAESVEVATPGSRAFESGTWVGTWTTPAGPLRTGGRYAAYWTKLSGSWRLHAELFVTLFCDGADCF